MSFQLGPTVDTMGSWYDRILYSKVVAITEMVHEPRLQPETYQ
jgi:hypothetical protein